MQPLDIDGNELFIGDRFLHKGQKLTITSIGHNPPGNIFVGHKGFKSKEVKKIPKITKLTPDTMSKIQDCVRHYLDGLIAIERQTLQFLSKDTETKESQDFIIDNIEKERVLVESAIDNLNDVFEAQYAR